MWMNQIFLEKKKQLKNFTHNLQLFKCNKYNSLSNLQSLKQKFKPCTHMTCVELLSCLGGHVGTFPFHLDYKISWSCLRYTSPKIDRTHR